MSLWGDVLQMRPRARGRVVAHVLDPINGYSNRELTVGKDIDADIVRRLGENGEVFLIVAYEVGVPSAILCSRAQWLRIRARQDAVDRADDAAVWRSREELRIS
jgi:hypothetical protein